VNSRTPIEVRASSAEFVGLDSRAPAPSSRRREIGTEEAMAAADVPIRHIDNTEVPASGMWPAVGASSVVRSTGRRGASVSPVAGGWLEVGDGPATNALCIELDDSILLATACASRNGHAPSEWHLEGFACTAERREPLALTLSYHGVFRRGVDTLAWWSGEGTIVARDGRRAHRLRRRSAAGADRLVVELLFAAPAREGVSLTNVVAYMLHRANAAAAALEARRAAELSGADPTFEMLQRILGAAQADLDVSSPRLPAQSPARPTVPPSQHLPESERDMRLTRDFFETPIS
jgi:hypothetical protein